MPISPKSCPDFSQNLPLPPFEADQVVSSHCPAKTLFTDQALLDLLLLVLNISL